MDTLTAQLKFWWSVDSITHADVDLWPPCITSISVCFPRRRSRSDPGVRRVSVAAAIIASCCTVHQGIFFHGDQWETVCSRAAVWRSRGDQLGCVAWWQQRVKIESNQGSRAWSRFIRLPTAFSLHLSLLPPFFLPRSLSFYLTPTGLEVCATY